MKVNMAVEFQKILYGLRYFPAEPSDDLETRLGNLKTFFLLSLYRNICRSLFEKDKLLFSFLLAVRLMEFRNELDQDAYRFLLTGGVSLKDQLPEHPSIKLKGRISTGSP
jgi:dynein heavy chain